MEFNEKSIVQRLINMMDKPGITAEELLTLKGAISICQKVIDEEAIEIAESEIEQ